MVADQVEGQQEEVPSMQEVLHQLENVHHHHLHLLLLHHRHNNRPLFHHTGFRLRKYFVIK